MEQVLQWLESIPTGLFLFAGAVLTILIGLTRFIYREIQRKRLKKRFHRQDMQKVLKSHQQSHEMLMETHTTVSHLLQEINKYHNDLRSVVQYPALYDTSSPIIQEFHNLLNNERDLMETVETYLSEKSSKRKYTDEEYETIQHFLDAPQRLREAFTNVKLQVETRGWEISETVDNTLLETSETVMETLLDRTYDVSYRTEASKTLSTQMNILAERHIPRNKTQYIEKLSSTIQHIVENLTHEEFLESTSQPETDIPADIIERNMNSIASEASAPVRDPERIPVVLQLLEIFWKHHTEIQLGSLLSRIAEIYDVPDVYYLEDDTVIDYLSTETRALSSYTSHKDYRRYAILDTLQEYWDLYPDTRLGQIVQNIATIEQKQIEIMEDKTIILSLLRTTNISE